MMLGLVSMAARTRRTATVPLSFFVDASVKYLPRRSIIDRCSEEQHGVNICQVAAAMKAFK
jgi:hypothetical protein